MTDRCVTKLLPDDPTAQDVFGSHQRVASAVTNLITSENVGKTVAITGSWGSGKSSVLRMIRRQLGQGAEVFIFDAWAHEGDPLRRTFLERLIDFLWGDNPNNEVTELKKDLLLRKKTKDDRATPVLSTEAKVIGLSLLLVPAGLAMFAAMVRIPKISWDYLSIALLLALLPMVILLLLTSAAGLRAGVLALKSRASGHLMVAISFVCVVIVGFLVYRNAVFAKIVFVSLRSHWLSAVVGFGALVSVIMCAIFRSTGAFENVFPLLLNRTVTTSRSESVESADPSSVEFQRWFASIVNIHRRENTTKKLVIAIDNLDRVDPGIALQLWSTMRTFFEFDFDMNRWAECVWLLAAFDVKALYRLWPDADGSAESFVKKTFQVTFSVPSLVLLKRDEFLLQQLRSAFPLHSDLQFQKVISLYGLKHFGDVSTPRDITNFVNSIGSIHRQWYDDIPLVQQAQYVIASSARADITTILTSAAAPPESPEELVGSDWRDALTAIHFNVPITEAAHVFMAGPLLSSLTTGDATSLSRLVRIRGFSRILSDIVIRNPTLWLNSTQTQNLTNAILALNSVGVDDNDEGVKTAWRWWTDAACRMEKWTPMTDRTGNALAILIKRAADPIQTQKLLESAGRAIPRTSDGAIDNSASALQKYVSEMKVILDLLPLLPSNFTLPVAGSGKTYVNLLSAAKKVLHNKFYDVAPRLVAQNPGEITNVLSEIVKSIQVHEDFVRLIAMLSAHRMHLEWEPLIQAIELIFGNTNNNFLQDGFKTSLEAALMLTNTDPAAIDMLKKLASKGALHHFLALTEKVSTRTGAVLVLIFLLFHPVDPSEWPGRAREGARWFAGWLNEGKRYPAEIKRIADLANEFAQLQRLRDLKKSSTNLSPVITEILEALPASG